ncbi:MAG: glycosyltransferase family A protein [bacterium]|nr:glycosyltransferase family A protein [bacterium]
MKSKSISVVIPCYNYGHFLGEAIESVLIQTRKPNEILVLDDGSTDNTFEVASQYPVKVIRHRINIGVVMQFK